MLGKSILKISKTSVSIEKKQLLNVEDFEVNNESIVGILGQNGSGKTTLFNVLSENIHFKGNLDFWGTPHKKVDRPYKVKNLAILPQKTQINFNFSAFEVVELGLIPLSISHEEAQHLIEKTMRWANCWQLHDRAYPTLSGGEQQRVNFARVTLQLSQSSENPILLLDEPLSAQDLSQQHLIFEKLAELRQSRKMTSLIILHDINLALKYCDTVLCLKEGEVVAQGPPKDTLTLDSIYDIWSYRAQSITHENSKFYI